jgi:hypothetical protein
LRSRNESRLLRKQEYCLQRTNLANNRNKKNCVWGTNLVDLRNKNIASKEQISSTKGTRCCARGTNLIDRRNKEKFVQGINLVYLGNKNIPTKEQISYTKGIQKLHLRNKSCLPEEQDIASKEQISSTKGTRCCARGTNLVNRRTNKNLSKEQICLPGEQEYTDWGTNLIY